MAGRAASSDSSRIVVFSRDPAFCGRDGAAPRAACVACASAYEAASEILAAPAAALLLDLRALSMAHLRLLDIARQMGLEILASGPLPSGMTSEHLSGVRLVSQKNLPAVLAGLAERPAEPSPDEHTTTEQAVGESVAGKLMDDEPAVDEPVDSEPMSDDEPVDDESMANEPMSNEPAPRPTRPDCPPQADASQPAPATSNYVSHRPRQGPSRPAATGGHAGPLLSDAELSALLENEQ